MDHHAECFRRYLDGDESGFDELITELRDSITFFIQRIVGDPYIAEDLCIDTFMELLLHKRRYNFKIPLKNYLFMVARSRAIDHVRHVKRFTMVELSEAENQTAEHATPEDTVLKNEQHRSLHSAMRPCLPLGWSLRIRRFIWMPLARIWAKPWATSLPKAIS